MLAPGSSFSSGRVDITAGAAQAATRYNQGVGFLADGSIAVDTNAVAGNIWRNGIRQSANGAFYGTTSAAGTDVFVSGIRVSITGQLVFEAAAQTGFSNGNPRTSNGRFATA